MTKRTARAQRVADTAANQRIVEIWRRCVALHLADMGVSLEEIKTHRG